jgi:hypothetical protein
MEKWICYEVRDLLGKTTGTITIPSTTSPTTNDVNILSVLKDGGFIPTRTDHSIEGQDPALIIRDLSRKHVLTIVCKDAEEKWICCGHDIRALCEKAGTSPPAKCFFCGKPRKNVVVSPQPEDSLAFELAEIWCGKIREYHGDPEAHFPSLDQYGRVDVEAWRAVARHVLKNPSSSHSKIFTASECEFIVFTVRENNQRVGTIALLPSWSENDVMIELQSRRYPTGGRVKFDGWPSTSKFKLEIEGDELHVFHFERKT